MIGRSSPLAGPTPEEKWDYPVLSALANWCLGAIDPVVSLALQYKGLELITGQQWENYQTALLLLMLTPLVMPPTRESILELVRHSSFLAMKCRSCGKEDCRGNTLEMPTDSMPYGVQRAGHHKTDTQVGLLKSPFPHGLAALIWLWDFASAPGKCTNRKATTWTLFYNFRTGDPFDSRSLSTLVLGKLEGIMREAGLERCIVRDMRHLFATGFSDFAASCGQSDANLRKLQGRAAELMGTSRGKWQVS